MAENDKALLAKVTSANEKTTGNAPEPARKFTIEAALETRKAKFTELLAGSGMNADRFIRIVFNEIAGNKKLMAIAVENPASIIGACMEIAELGLDPSVPNEVFLIPYGQVAQAQLGYKGLMKLAAESAVQLGTPFTTLRADMIHEGDIYEREYGDKPKITHKPPPFGKERGKLLGFVAIAKDKAGRINFREMTVAEVQEHQKRFCKSLKNSSSPFFNGQNFDAYGLKTVLRRLVSKDLTMSAKLSRALAVDNASENTIEVESKTVEELPLPQPVGDGGDSAEAVS